VGLIGPPTWCQEKLELWASFGSVSDIYFIVGNEVLPVEDRGGKKKRLF